MKRATPANNYRPLPREGGGEMVLFLYRNRIRFAASTGNQGFAAITTVSNGGANTAPRHHSDLGKGVIPATSTATSTTRIPRRTPKAPPSKRSSKPKPTAFSISEISMRANAKTSSTAMKTST